MDIVRITIKGESGYGPVDEAFSDKVTITDSSIKYEYKPHPCSNLECQTAHCGRYIPHFDFGAKPSPIVPYRHLPQSLSGMTADCRSLV